MNIKQLGIIFNEILEYQMDNVPLAKTTAVYKLAQKGLSMLTPPIDNKAVDDEAIKAMAEKEYPNASVGPLCGPLQREAYIKGVKDMINAITNPTKTKQPAKIAGH